MDRGAWRATVHRVTKSWTWLSEHTCLTWTVSAASFFYLPFSILGLPWWLRWKIVCLQCGRPEFDPWVGKITWRRKWQPTPVLLPEKSHGWRSLVGYSPRGCKESDTTEWLHFLFFFSCLSPSIYHKHYPSTTSLKIQCSVRILQGPSLLIAEKTMTREWSLAHHLFLYK